MKNFKLDDIKTLIEEALKEPDTGDPWLDARYYEHIPIIGHTNPYYRLFWLIAKTLKPDLTVELGSWRGDGSAHFAVGNPAGECIAIDIHKDSDYAGLAKLKEAAEHLPNLTFVQAWSWDAIEQVRALDRKIDLLFIDSWHDYDHAKQDWDLYSPLLADTALVICDDITTAFNFDGMLRFWEELPGEKFLDDRVHRGAIPMGFLKFEREKPKGKKGK